MPAIAIAVERHKTPPEMPQRLREIGIGLGLDPLLVQHLGIVAHILVLLGAKLCQIFIVIVDEWLFERPERAMELLKLVGLENYLQSQF